MNFELTLRILRNTDLLGLYQKLLLRDELSSAEAKSLLTLAVIFLNSDNKDVERLGYRIILFYSNLRNDYLPLYDVSLNKSYTPITKFIEKTNGDRLDFSVGFFRVFAAAFGERFKQDKIYLTEQQLGLNESVSKTGKDDSVAIVAPTSYGKSELILGSLATGARNICVIVPTKALIAQTKRRILNSKQYSEDRKIISHPEMYQKGDANFIAVLTQERLLRLLQLEETLAFDLVFVDEAHNLLEKEDRSRLLASAIIILQNRSKETCFKFLTPFLYEPENLKISHADLEFKAIQVDEYLKSERLYYYDFSESRGLEIYDQFLNVFVPDGGRTFQDDFSLIKGRGKSKNIIYINKPSDIEEVAQSISKISDEVLSETIERACDALAEYVHKDYFLINCLKRGVVYHHGAVPDIVKLYVEKLFSTCDEVSFIATTSTLLEGVNIPAQCLFLLDYKKGPRKLSPSQFKNLVGRVCRFKEIFDPSRGGMKFLEPEIYIVSSRYMDGRANIRTFLEDCMKVDKKHADHPENVLLEHTEVTTEAQLKTRKDSEEFLENFEPGVIKGKEVKRAQTEFGRACFQNSVYEIDVLAVEHQCQAIVDQVMIFGSPIDDADGVLKAIDQIFLSSVTDAKLKRLTKDESKAFYAMFLNWRVENVSFSEMINNFLRYWQSRESIDPLVYVGRWGNETKGEGHNPYWTDIRPKSQTQRINLAIVRIKEEQDFLDNQIVKFIEVLFDLGLLDRDFYEKIRFGTADPGRIALIKNGFSSALAGLMIENYTSSFKIAGDRVTVSADLKKKMIENKENEILIFELECNLREVSS